MMRCAWTHDGMEAFLDACYASLNISAPREEAKAAVDNAAMLSFYHDDKPIGAAIFTENGSVHIAIAKEYRGRWLNKTTLTVLLDAFNGCVLTHIKPSNRLGVSFAERTGWTRRGTDGEYAIYAR